MVVFYATEIWGDLLYTQNNTIKCLFEKKKSCYFMLRNSPRYVFMDHQKDIDLQFCHTGLSCDSFISHFF